MIEYFETNYSREESKKIFQELLNPSKPFDLEVINENCTLDMLKKNYQLFLLQTGYVTFHELFHVNGLLRFPNEEVQRSVAKIIFQSLDLRVSFGQGSFEIFLNQLMNSFDLIEKKETGNTEETNSEIKKFKEQLLSQIKTLMIEPLENYKNCLGEEFAKKCCELYYTNILHSFYLVCLNWKNWSYAYQQSILDVETKNPETRKHDFSFTKNEVEVFIEFLKKENNYEEGRKYHKKAKSTTNKLIEVHVQYDDLEKRILKCGVYYYRRGEGRMMNNIGNHIYVN